MLNQLTLVGYTQLSNGTLNFNDNFGLTRQDHRSCDVTGQCENLASHESEDEAAPLSNFCKYTARCAKVFVVTLGCY